jgi:uncharacterized protein (DUF2249 family)
MGVTTERIAAPAEPPHLRQTLISAAFDALPTGGAFETAYDRDPAPLQLEFERPRSDLYPRPLVGSCPDQCRVRIGGVRAGAADGRGGSCACTDA